MTYPEKFIRKPSDSTPWIILEPERVFIMGRSIPENPGEFFRPVHEWITHYANNNEIKSQIDLGFEYINTSSTKWIFTILKEISAMKDIKSNVRVVWYYEQGDEDMCDLGLILRSLVDCPFIVAEVDEMNKERYEKIFSDPI